VRSCPPSESGRPVVGRARRRSTDLSRPSGVDQGLKQVSLMLSDVDRKHEQRTEQIFSNAVYRNVVQITLLVGIAHGQYYDDRHAIAPVTVRTHRS